MAEKSNESTIIKLLEDLHSAETYNRNDAIKTIIKNKINDERVIDALLQSVSSDPSLAVRNFARSALDTFGVEHSEVEKDGPIVVAAHKKENSRDNSLNEIGNGQDQKGNSIESKIIKLLEDLQTDEVYYRNDAIKTIIADKINDRRVIDALLQVVESDPSRSVRNFARYAIDIFNAENGIPKPTSISTKVTDLRVFMHLYNMQITGFVGWYLFNGVFWYLILGGSFDFSNIGVDGAMYVNGLCIFPLNLLFLIGLSINKETREISYGILIALAVNFSLSLVFSSLFNGICFLPFYLQ